MVEDRCGAPRKLQSHSSTSRLAPSLARLLVLVIHLHFYLPHHCTIMNISGTLNVFRLLRDPTLCLPQHTVPTFNHLPIPLSKAFPRKEGKDGEKQVDIRAVVLDKDNCFAVPHTDEVYQPYKVGSAPKIFVS